MPTGYCQLVPSPTSLHPANYRNDVYIISNFREFRTVIGDVRFLIEFLSPLNYYSKHLKI